MSGTNLFIFFVWGLLCVLWYLWAICCERFSVLRDIWSRLWFVDIVLHIFDISANKIIQLDTFYVKSCKVISFVWKKYFFFAACGRHGKLRNIWTASAQYQKNGSRRPLFSEVVFNCVECDRCYSPQPSSPPMGPVITSIRPVPLNARLVGNLLSKVDPIITIRITPLPPPSPTRRLISPSPQKIHFFRCLSFPIIS